MDPLAPDLNRIDHATMDSWSRWIAAIADSSTVLTVTIAGRFSGHDWDMGERSLDEHMLHAVTNGGQEGRVGDAAIRTRPGDLLWVPPRVPQDLHRAAAARSLRKTYLRFRLERAGRPIPAPRDQPPVRAMPGAAALLGEAVDEHLHPRPHGSERIRAILILLFIAWQRAISVPGGLPEGRRTRLLALLAEDPTRRWDPCSIAEALDVSPVHLNRQVRVTFGMPVRRLLVEHRVRAAAADLADGGGVAATAARHGWSDPFLFSRQFRQVFGVPPRTWARSSHPGAVDL